MTRGLTTRAPLERLRHRLVRVATPSGRGMSGRLAASTAVATDKSAVGARRRRTTRRSWVRRPWASRFAVDEILVGVRAGLLRGDLARRGHHTGQLVLVAGVVGPHGQRGRWLAVFDAEAQRPGEAHPLRPPRRSAFGPAGATWARYIRRLEIGFRPAIHPDTEGARGHLVDAPALARFATWSPRQQ